MPSYMQRNRKTDDDSLWVFKPLTISKFDERKRHERQRNKGYVMAWYFL